MDLEVVADITAAVVVAVATAEVAEEETVADTGAAEEETVAATGVAEAVAETGEKDLIGAAIEEIGEAIEEGTGAVTGVAGRLCFYLFSVNLMKLLLFNGAAPLLFWFSPIWLIATNL